MSHSLSLNKGLGHKPGLAGRRQATRVRRLAACLCAGLAVLCALQTVTGAVARTPVLVASRRVERGERIEAGMVRLEQVPASPLAAKLLNRREQALGKLALIDLEPGQPIAGTALGRSPVQPQGTTTIRLALASAPESIQPGQRVRLVSSTGCEGAESPPAQSGQEEGQGWVKGRCLIAQEAVTMALPQDRSKTGTLGPGDKGQEAELTAFALKPEDAIKALSLPEGAPIIALAAGGG
ncbi:SAF domain protein [Bifidobacterium actinocoloniiforme DSM 22766]|uniref:SAF domain protein n=1 Tax=Bifidobacterium actinocoloniiforme DSM 22766 TaxID=1437605 RepID=A0A086YYL5_9BIFI|nr:SAF domain-containing protein [Bifidobacterium actinocoloniiforme]AKV55891.1 hypothetical protein AB656_06805 [Bifidobacterium actinocoloniiforme DSM 22766]KFI39365.1 SAF domain protein [Bifidobacterium actinocoloniiforme DSM 22766]